MVDSYFRKPQLSHFVWFNLYRGFAAVEACKSAQISVRDALWCEAFGSVGLVKE